jgi:hypothetical protein
MNMQVDIYVTSNNEIQVLLQGPAQGLATFNDFSTFARFIEGCQRFIDSQTKADDSTPSIPKPFLDAFNDANPS